MKNVFSRRQMGIQEDYEKAVGQLQNLKEVYEALNKLNDIKKIVRGK